MTMKNILFAIAFIFCVLHTYGQEKFVRDVDGNRYKVLTYGSQLWLQENMRSTHDRDGNAFVTQDFSNNPNLPSMYVPGGNEKNVATYGLLYNWEAAQKVCPQGWRLPSVEDWRELVLYLSHDEKNCCGGEPKLLAKSMAAPVLQWRHFEGYDETECSTCVHPENNNASGFCAYPAGLCPAGYYSQSDGGYDTILYHDSWNFFASFWSSSEKDNSCFSFGLGDKEVFLTDRPKVFGLSVRCVKDHPTTQKLFCPADNVLPLPIKRKRVALRIEDEEARTCAFVHAPKKDTLYFYSPAELDLLVVVHADLLVPRLYYSDSIKVVNIYVSDIFRDDNSAASFHYENGEFRYRAGEDEDEDFSFLHRDCFEIWAKYVDVLSKMDFWLPTSASEGIYHLTHTFRLRTIYEAFEIR